VLHRSHCPHTGVVNFFAAAEPFLAIGSVIRTGAAQPYHWRCYVGAESTAGAAPDMRSAERELVGSYRELLRATVTARQGRSVSKARHGVRAGRKISSPNS
jgi:hypothetical protein